MIGVFRVNRIVNNKHRKYKWLYETYGRDMYSYGLAFGLDQEQVEDAIHDVFLSLYENDSNLWNSENKKYYLLTCLKNEIRSSKRRVVNFEKIEEINEYDFLLDVSGLELIEEQEEREEIIKTLQEMMNSITGKQREAIYMRYTLNRSFDEISSHFNIKTKTAQKLVYRAIEKLRLNFHIKPVHVLLSFIISQLFRF